jgi:hypothetical protein
MFDWIIEMLNAVERLFEDDFLRVWPLDRF